MPASVLVVHDDPVLREDMVEVLREAGIQVAAFECSLQALDAIEADTRVRVLVTRVELPPGTLSGPALARMLRLKRADIQVVFVARSRNEAHTEGLGVFLPLPLVPAALVEEVERLLEETLAQAHPTDLQPSAV